MFIIKFIETIAILLRKPKEKEPTTIVNNYFIKKTGCGGNCHCHDKK